MNIKSVPCNNLGIKMNIVNYNSNSTSQEEEFHYNYLSPFQINDQIIKEEGLEEENIYLNKAEENQVIFPSEENFKFSLFTPKKKNYYYDSLYSKELVFKVFDIPKRKEEKEIIEGNNSEKGKGGIDTSLEIEESIHENKYLGKKHERKRSDHKRKRIKSNFCNHIIKILNKKLKLINSFLRFEKFPQCEIINVAKNENKKIFNFTLKEMLLYKAFENIPHLKLKNQNREIITEIERERNNKEWEHNNNILKFLEVEGNKVINDVLNKKLKDIYEEYLISDEFQQSLEELRGEGKYHDYIHEYFITAQTFLKYYEVM